MPSSMLRLEHRYASKGDTLVLQVSTQPTAGFSASPTFKVAVLGEAASV